MWVFSASNCSIPTGGWGGGGGCLYGWMDERMNGRVAFLLFDRLATADLASRNRWELGAERGGEGGLNYGWMDDVGGGVRGVWRGLEPR